MLLGDIMHYLAENVRNLRDEWNLTQKELANKIGTSQAIISKIENGHYPEIDIVCRLSELFDVTLDDLFYRPRVVSGSKRNRLKYNNSTELLMLLDEDDRKQIVLMIDFLLYRKKIKEKHRR